MRHTVRQALRWGTALAMGCCLLTTATPAARAATAAGPAFANLPREVLHEVEAGQNLHLIAGYYYGDARQWVRIWQGNRDVVRNPNRIAKGTVLRIPVAPEWRQEASYADWLKMGGAERARVPQAIRAPGPIPAPSADSAPPAPSGQPAQSKPAAPPPAKAVSPPPAKGVSPPPAKKQGAAARHPTWA